MEFEEVQERSHCPNVTVNTEHFEDQQWVPFTKGLNLDFRLLWKTPNRNLTHDHAPQHTPSQLAIIINRVD